MNTPVDRSKMRTEGQPAPGSLVLVQGFLNTWSDELGIEDFATTRCTELWLRDAGLWTSSRKVSSKQHQKVVRFRDDLRTWILDKDHSQPLSDLAGEVSFEAEFCTSGEIVFQPTGDACNRVIGALIGVISHSQKSGTWERLKCCDLPSCGWAFYDRTRSRTKRWCSMKTCGSRHKSRAYYQRKR